MLKKISNVDKLSIVRRKTVLKTAVTIAMTANIVGCSIGNPYVHEADRNDIITIGDSIFDLSGEIQLFLEEYAGQTFRNYTQSGAELDGGIFARPIVDQYADAKSVNPNISTIVMDGGGNDILIPAVIFDPYGCKTHWWRWNISNSCENLINDIYVEAVTMLNGMDSDGIDNILYLGYYYTTGFNANLRQAIDYGDYRLEQACSNSTVNCTFIDPRNAIDSSDIISDGIHPSTSGSRKISNLIWPHLQSIL